MKYHRKLKKVADILMPLNNDQDHLPYLLKLALLQALPPLVASVSAFQYHNRDGLNPG